MSKTKYLITDAWNGEGYSDSDIEILEVENYLSGSPKQEELKEKLLNRIINLYNLKSIEITDAYITYQIDNDCQDAGTYYFEPLTKDILAVAIFPNICEHEVIRDKDTFDKYKYAVCDALAEEYTDYEEHEIFGYCAECKGKDDSDLILCEVTS
tara:strand:+ start:163 stop:624 length:462 start_codon:yes stop_codon:yes gene_type:complete